MIDNKTIREVVIADKLFPGGSGEPTYEDRTAGGAVANFETNNTLDIVSGIFGIPYNENGYSSLNVVQRGKNLVDFSATTITSQSRILDNVFLKAGNYVFSIDLKDTSNIAGSFNIRIGTTSIGTVGFNGGYDGRIEKAFTLTNDSSINIVLGGSVAGYSYSISNCQIELGSTATTYEPYTGSTYTISWAAVDVYGGDVNITTGKLLSKYDSEGNLLPDPVEISITPVTISTLEGINNIYADSGKVDVIYKYQTGTEPTSKVNKWLPIFYPIRKEKY